MTERPAVRMSVAQLGARMHYAVPQLLHQRGLLETLYTDFATPPALASVFRGLGLESNALFRRVSGRVVEGIPTKRVCSFRILGLAYALRLTFAHTAAHRAEIYVRTARWFNDKVVRKGFADAGAIYCFNTAGLEIMQNAVTQSIDCVLEQTIAPKRVELEILSEEYEHYGRWEVPERLDDRWSAELIAREEAEWEWAARIVCGSEFVKEKIAQLKPHLAHKVLVVPYGVNAAPANIRKERSKGRPLRVLFVGAVGLRKGIHYLATAAQLVGHLAEFRVVGPIQIRTEAKSLFPENVQLVGPVPRTTVKDHLAWADVMLLPSLCEGSATACYEALVAQVPLLVTPNAGAFISDGVEGFVVEARDPNAIAAKLQLLARDNELLEELRANTVRALARISLTAYGDRFIAALEKPLATKTP